MLAHLAVLAGVAAVVLAPWPLAAVAARRRARRERESLGPARGEVTPPDDEDGTTTLRGELASDDPCTSFEGGRAAAATAWYRRSRRSRPGEGHVRASELLLTVGDARVRLEGPVRVAVGSREVHPRRRLQRLPEAIQGRVYRAVDSSETGWWQGHVRFRSVQPGDTVRVRGRLERELRKDEEAHYREGAERWKLVPASTGDGEPAAIELVAERPGWVRMPPRGWLARAIVLCVLLLGALPWGLYGTGNGLREASNDTLRDCDTGGFATYRWADRAHALAGAFPGWRTAGLDARARDVGSAVNGARVCAIDDAPSPPMLEELVRIARERLPRLSEEDGFDAERSELEATLHEHGRDRAIVALRRHLPRGGDVRERVRAHLYLGDLDGAAETWREPGARADSWLGRQVVQKGNVLCMAGDHEAALDAFAELVNADHSETEMDLYGPELYFRYGECAVRAGELERAEQLATEVSRMERGLEAATWIRARIALVRGDRREALRHARSERSSSLAHGLLAASLLAEDGRWDELGTELETGKLRYQLRRPQEASRLYSAIYHPGMDADRLSTLADRTAEGAKTTGDEELRARASDAYLTLALLRARRRDPAAAEAFDRARALSPDETARVDRLRAAFAFHHGDWKVPEDVELPALRRLGRAYRGDAAIDAAAPSSDVALGLHMLNPSGLVAERSIAALHGDDDMPDAHKLELLRVQKLEAPLPTIFYRLTQLVVHGARFGLDPKPVERQMASLREMIRAQPNPYLLTGLDGSKRL